MIRKSGNEVPFFIFAGQDRPEFRREAAARGAQLSTNDMLELVDNVVKYLGEKGVMRTPSSCNEGRSLVRAQNLSPPPGPES
jgi:hypothetical protein